MRFVLSLGVMVALVTAFVGCAKPAKASTHGRAAEQATPGTRTLAQIASDARGAGTLMQDPGFERTPEAMKHSVDAAIRDAEAALDAIAAQGPQNATFQSVFVAYDRALYGVGCVANRAGLLKEVSTDPALRAACDAQVMRLQDWFIGVAYRRDIYDVCEPFASPLYAAAQGARTTADKELVRDRMRDYDRAGMGLDAQAREQIEALRKELGRLETAFLSNITNATAVVRYTAEELEGVPPAVLESAAVEDGVYEIDAMVVPYMLAVLENASDSETRRRLLAARFAAAPENVAVANAIAAVRAKLAQLLGYSSWADYKTEPQMSGSAAAATAFLERLRVGLDSKFRQERETLRALKVKETGDTTARLELWDMRYYTNKLMQSRFEIDTDAIRAYFPFEQTVQGMLGVYEDVFGLRFEEVAIERPWHESVTAYATYDSATDELMGVFYMDPYPREGKFGHFAQFGVTGGRLEPGGARRAPVCAIVCNFNPPAGDTPSLLSHREVETLFHEFGHAMHTILSRAEHSSQAGTSVPRDFVETPSQVLEMWAWDHGVLSRIARDYRDPSKRFDHETLARMRDAREATTAAQYRRQLVFGTGDLAVHMAGPGVDVVQVYRDAYERCYVPEPDGTHFVTILGHYAGYDASYYGYAWGHAIALDMAGVFDGAAEGLMDAGTGRRLRREIFEVGGSRPVQESVRAFLGGREWSVDPFLRYLGVDESGV